jgi:hypothetical protein
MLLRTLSHLGLPLSPCLIDEELIKERIDCIRDHRGGLLRLVIPTTQGGVTILREADIGLLVESLFPIPGLPM